MLGAMSPKWKNMTSSIPLSSHITTQELVGVILWYIAYIPLVMVPPERLQRPFIFSSAAFACTLIGLLAWSVPKTKGGGPLFHTVNTASSTPYSMMLGITAILSSWGYGTIGQSDWVGRFIFRFLHSVPSRGPSHPLTIFIFIPFHRVTFSHDRDPLPLRLLNPFPARHIYTITFAHCFLPYLQVPLLDLLVCLVSPSLTLVALRSVTLSAATTPFYPR